MARKSKTERFLDSMIWGFGRDIGTRSAKSITKSIGKKIVDPNTSFRKTIEKFQLPGTFKGAVSKMYTLIDAFETEYKHDDSFLQKSWYMQEDIRFIDEKIQRVERLVFADTEENAYNRLVFTWERVKQEYNG